MFKFLWRRYVATPCEAADWRHDPLGHPALTGMSLRELADLPMVPEAPMRVTRVEVTEHCRRRVSRIQTAACTASH